MSSSDDVHGKARETARMVIEQLLPPKPRPLPVLVPDTISREEFRALMRRAHAAQAARGWLPGGPKMTRMVLRLPTLPAAGRAPPADSNAKTAHQTPREASSKSMLMIIRRDTVRELRDHVAALQTAKAGLTRTAKEAETAAAAAVRDQIGSLNRQLFQSGQNNTALTAELGQVQAELRRARSELAVLRPPAAPAAGTAAHITIAVKTDYGRAAGWDRMGWDARHDIIEREVTARKEKAAGKLAALLDVMQNTGLLDTGVGAALGSDVRAAQNHGSPVDQITRHRLQIARDRIYTSGLDLLALPPDAVLVLDQTTMTVLGDPPDVAELSIAHSNEWDIR